MAERPIRIVYVIDSLVVGGAERHLVRILDGLRLDTDWTASVYCLQREGPFLNTLESSGVRVWGPTTPWSRSPYRVLRSLLSLWYFMRKERPDIAHCYLISGGLFGAVTAWLAGVPHVITTRRVVHVRRGIPNLRYRLAMKIMDLISDAVIAVSNVAAQQAILEGTPPSKLRVVLNSVPLRESMRTAVKPTHESPVVGCVARLFPDKGQKYLIEAIPRVLASFPSCRFVFVGGGPDAPALKDRAAALGISPSITFLGDRTDVLDLLDDFDAVVLPSLAEGIPNVVLEAFSARIPVVATSAGGTPEVVIHEDTGLLVPPASPVALSDAVIRMLSDAEMRRLCTRRAYELVSSRFTPKRELRETLEVYRAVLSDT